MLDVRASDHWQVESKRIGRDSPCFIIAEIGANHDGDIRKAKNLIQIAANAGADAVKFQTYTADELVADRERIIEWGPPGAKVKEKVGDMFDRVTLKREAYIELYAMARSLGMLPFSTPFSPDGVDFLHQLESPIFKIASSDVSNLPLLDAIAKTKRPIIMSAGKSTLEEVEEAIQFLKTKSCSQIALLHCVASYPAPDEDCHLRVIELFRKRFSDLIIGFSDHTPGSFAPSLAVSLGAKIIEKHITYDHSAYGPDHHFSLDPEELKDLVHSIRRAERMLGKPEKIITPSEEAGRIKARPSIMAAKDIEQGQIIEKDMLKICRPGTGLAPKMLGQVIGQAARRPVKQNEPITSDCI